MDQTDSHKKKKKKKRDIAMILNLAWLLSFIINDSAKYM